MSNSPYQILEVLGQGSFSRTYSAFNSKTHQSVIIKELIFGKIDNWKTLELFEREANILKNLNHPNIPKMLDYYEVKESNGRVHLVTEKVDGVTLLRRLKEGWRPEESEVRAILKQLLNILQYLHALNPPVIHRDLKPSNMVIDEALQVHLIDFGAVQATLKPTGQGGSTIVGTYGYMAPEQFSGRAIPASDIYALGVTMIHLLSGTPPADIAQQGLSLNFKPLLNCSPQLITLIEKMVEPIPEQRYSDVKSVLQALSDLNTCLQSSAAQTTKTLSSNHEKAVVTHESKKPTKKRTPSGTLKLKKQTRSDAQFASQSIDRVQIERAGDTLTVKLGKPDPSTAPPNPPKPESTTITKEAPTWLKTSGALVGLLFLSNLFIGSVILWSVLTMALGGGLFYLVTHPDLMQRNVFALNLLGDQNVELEFTPEDFKVIKIKKNSQEVFEGKTNKITQVIPQTNDNGRTGYLIIGERGGRRVTFHSVLNFTEEDLLLDDLFDYFSDVLPDERLQWIFRNSGRTF